MGKISIIAGISIIILSVILIVIGSLHSDKPKHHKRIIVQANYYGWTQTGINLLIGDEVEVRTFGEIKWDNKSSEPVNPSGANWSPAQTVHGANFLLPHIPIASLIGRIGGYLYNIGNGGILVARENGELVFGINEDWTDRSAWQDNQGQFEVEVINISRKVSKYAPLSDRQRILASNKKGILGYPVPSKFAGRMGMPKPKIRYAFIGGFPGFKITQNSQEVCIQKGAKIFIHHKIVSAGWFVKVEWTGNIKPTYQTLWRWGIIDPDDKKSLERNYNIGSVKQISSIGNVVVYNRSYNRDQNRALQKLPLKITISKNPIE